MITESEKKALQLAKKVFEHFTHDALSIAREIIAMELELGEAPVNSELPVREIILIFEVKKTAGQQINELLNDFPASNIKEAIHETFQILCYPIVTRKKKPVNIDVYKL